MITLALLVASLHVVDVDVACMPHVPAPPVPLAPALSSAPPVVVVKSGKVSFDLDSARVGDVLAAIANKAGVAIVGNGAGLQAPLVGWVRDAPIAETIEAVAHSGGLVVWRPPAMTYELVEGARPRKPKPYIVLPRDDLHAFLLARAREREKQMPTTTRVIEVPARDAAAWVEPLAKVALSCRGGVEAVARARALFISDMRDQLDFVERAIDRRVAGVERMRNVRDERIERTAACPVGGADATNAKALALARTIVGTPSSGKGAGRIIGCPAPVALVAGDVVDPGRALLDLSFVPPTREVPWPAGTGDAAADEAARARYDAERALQIDVSTRSAIAQALRDKPTRDTVWAVKLPDAASADAFAAVVTLAEERAVVARAPNDVVFVRGDLEMDEHIVDMAARVPGVVRDLPALMKQKREEQKREEREQDDASAP